MFWWFGKKKDIKQLEEDTKKGFEAVKKDMNSVGEWIKHLNSERKEHKREIEEIKEILSTMQIDIDSLKNIVSIMNELKPKHPFKTQIPLSKKQTGVYAVQTGVQTGVQTPKLDQFSLSERAIIWVLLNSDMKLSYEDIASVLGKEKTTIRGQINAIKQKSEGLIEEFIEINGKKRIYIPEKMREKLLKKVKVRVNNEKILKKELKNSRKNREKL